jgi:hypothetical protein
MSALTSALSVSVYLDWRSLVMWIGLSTILLELWRRSPKRKLSQHKLLQAQLTKSNIKRPSSMAFLFANRYARVTWQK